MTRAVLFLVATSWLAAFALGPAVLAQSTGAPSETHVRVFEGVG